MMKGPPSKSGSAKGYGDKRRKYYVEHGQSEFHKQRSFDKKREFEERSKRMRKYGVERKRLEYKTGIRKVQTMADGSAESSEVQKNRPHQDAESGERSFYDRFFAGEVDGQADDGFADLDQALRMGHERKLRKSGGRARDQPARSGGTDSADTRGESSSVFSQEKARFLDKQAEKDALAKERADRDKERQTKLDVRRKKSRVHLARTKSGQPILSGILQGIARKLEAEQRQSAQPHERK